MKVKLIYFKRTGKYYTDEEYISENHEFCSVVDEISNLRSKDELPGLSKGLHTDFIILIDWVEGNVCRLIM